MTKTNVLVVTAILLVIGAFAGAPAFEELYYEQALDHFSWGDDRTFTQRYLIANVYDWAPGDPIFFYTGNEGDIENFYENTGFIFDSAPQFRALVVFAEHRMYGKSGVPDILDAEHLVHLTSEQALADFAELVMALKEKFRCSSSPVVAFGGSYGGMLSAWMRLKYPHIVCGAIAASAPVTMFEGYVDPLAYNAAVQDDFEAAGDCVNDIHDAIEKISSAGKSDWSTLTDRFHLCSPISSDSDVEALMSWAQNGLVAMTMVDYPYPNSFLRPVPAWPVRVACDAIAGSDDMCDVWCKLSNGLGAGYYNGTGGETCFNISETLSPSLGMIQWDYQSCTEMIFPVGSNGVSDFFPKQPWNLNEYVRQCKERWGVTARPNWVPLYYGMNVTAGSNIVFTQGALDPWKVGGIGETLSSSLIGITIDKSAHHLDLRFANPADPGSVIDARNIELEKIEDWIKEWQSSM